MKKQTAVEWLKELIECGADLELVKKSITKAKAMEKEQIIDAYRCGESNNFYRTEISAKKYYTSTYE